MTKRGIVALIPARSGSKRLPGKNIKPLFGRPLIEWTIQAAIDSTVFDRIIVSTDDEYIANLSEKAGAEVPFMRPSSLSDDDVRTDDVVIHVVDSLRKKELFDTEILVLLQPTSPLRTSGDIISALEVFREKSADGVVSLCECEHPIQFSGYLNDDFSLSGFIEPESLLPAQQLSKSFRLNGAIYIYSKKLIGNSRGFYESDSNCYAYVMSRANSVDIDTLDDFLFADYLLSRKLNR